ncbi:hypothetical protein Ocin01_06166, partial [Orchesella cincta]
SFLSTAGEAWFKRLFAVNILFQFPFDGKPTGNGDRIKPLRNLETEQVPLTQHASFSQRYGPQESHTIVLVEAKNLHVTSPARRQRCWCPTQQHHPRPLEETHDLLHSVLRYNLLPSWSRQRIE